jgi:hypothetical protein
MTLVLQKTPSTKWGGVHAARPHTSAVNILLDKIDALHLPPLSTIN